jgi:hypothetical protein
MLLALAAVVTACAHTGFPTAYDDQIDEATGLSNVEANWLEGCQVGFTEELAQNANAVCACSYKRIKTDIPFEDFVALNDRLKSDPLALSDRATVENSVEAKLVDIVKDCIAAG